MSDDEPFSQLAVRIPAALRKAVKLRCVETETPIQQFVWEALEEKLRAAVADTE